MNRIACPNCGNQLRYPPALHGRKAKCKVCEHQFRLPAAPPVAAPEVLDLPEDEPREVPPRRAAGRSVAEKSDPRPPTGAEPGARWYYMADGAPAGPLGLDELRRLAADGVLDRDTYVRTGDDGNWVAAATVSDVFPPAGPAAAGGRGRPRRRGSRRRVWVALGLLLVAGGGGAAWAVAANWPGRPGGAPVDPTGSGDPAAAGAVDEPARPDEVELVLWHLESVKSQLSRSRLIPRKDIPAANGDPYVTTLVNDFDQGMELNIVDERGPLRGGKEQHEWMIRPDRPGMRGFGRALWTGELSPDAVVTGARVRLACASSGTTELTVRLAQFNADPKAGKAETVWEGSGKVRCASPEWGLVTAELTAGKESGTPGRYLLLTVEGAGDNCRVSTGLDGKAGVMAADKEKFSSRLVTIAEGHAVAAGTPCARAAVFLRVKQP